MRARSLKNLYEHGKNYQPGDELTLGDERAVKLAALGLIELIEEAPAPAPAAEEHEPAVDTPKKKGKTVRSFQSK